MHILIYASLFTMAACSGGSRGSNIEKKTLRELINVPHYKIDSARIRNSNFELYLTDEKPFNNPTVFVQALDWYTFQILEQEDGFDSLVIDYSMPNTDHARNRQSASRLTLYRDLHYMDNTVFGDFTKEFFKLNWSTRQHYSEIHSSMLDRTNSLFARNIDTSEYRTLFPTNDTWFGIDAFYIFSIYFKDCSEERRGVAHQIIETIEKAYKYFPKKDRDELNALIVKYAELFKENKKN
jgi:hypothetical protein